LIGVDPQLSCDAYELGDVETALAPLVFGDERLWPSKALGQIGQGDGSLLAGLDQPVEDANIKLGKE
jgi:hypothetical protein